MMGSSNALLQTVSLYGFSEMVLNGECLATSRENLSVEVCDQ